MSCCSRCFPCSPAEKNTPIARQENVSYGSTATSKTVIGDQPRSPRGAALRTLNGTEVPVTVTFIFNNGRSVKFDKKFEPSRQNTDFNICRLVRNVDTSIHGSDKKFEKTSEDVLFLTRAPKKDHIQLSYGLWQKPAGGSFMGSFNHVQDECSLHVQATENKTSFSFSVVDPKALKGISGQAIVSQITIEFFP